jgi:hypothetical protein
VGIIKKRGERSGSNEGLPNWTPRRIVSWSLFALAAVIAAQHVLAHGGFRPVPMSMGLQDVFIGYPTAILLVIIGGIAMDPTPRI